MAAVNNTNCAVQRQLDPHPIEQDYGYQCGGGIQTSELRAEHPVDIQRSLIDISLWHQSWALELQGQGGLAPCSQLY